MDYKISVEEKSSVQKNIVIEIPRNEFDKEYNRALDRNATKVRMKGFRPGRAPKAMIDKMYGREIHAEVLQDVVSKAYQEAIQQHSLQVVGYPEFNIEDQDVEKDVKVTAGVTLYPQPTINDYMNSEFTVEVEQFEEDEIDHELFHLRDRFAETTEVEDRKIAENGDLVTIDYEATVDGNQFRGGRGTNTEVEIGSGRSLEVIEQSLIGLAIGEKKTIDIVLPADRNDDFAGKTAKYTLSLKCIETITRPEVDDELAKKADLGETVAEMREKLAEQIKEDITRKNGNARENELFRTIAEKNPFEIPQALVDEEIRVILFEMGVLNPRQEESFRFNVTPFRDGLGEAAELRVRRSIIISKIVDQEKMEFSDEELDSWLDELSQKEGRSRENTNRVYGYPKNIARLKDMMASAKMVEKLLASAKITEVVEEKNHLHAHHHHG